MNHKVTAFGGVESGKLKLSLRKQFDKDIRQFEGKRVQLTIQKAKKIRSNNQNAYLWGSVYVEAAHGFVDAGNIGFTPNDAHHFFRDRFKPSFKDVVIPKSGEVVKLATTTTASTTELMTYIEQISLFCAEWLGVAISPPSEILSLNN